jgi:hypothetical protein
MPETRAGAAQCHHGKKSAAETHRIRNRPRPRAVPGDGARRAVRPANDWGKTERREAFRSRDRGRCEPVPPAIGGTKSFSYEHRPPAVADALPFGTCLAYLPGHVWVDVAGTSSSCKTEVKK